MIFRQLWEANRSERSTLWSLHFYGVIMALKVLDAMPPLFDDRPMADHSNEVLAELQALLEGGLAPYHPSVQLVYLALWSRSRMNRRISGVPSEASCSVTQEDLSRQLGLGRRTVQRALKALQALGLINEVSPGGGRCPAVYRLSLPQGVRQMMWQRTIEAGSDMSVERDPERGAGDEWQDRLTSDDRALLGALIEGLSEPERSELAQEAHRRLAAFTVEPTPEQVAAETARLVMLRHFGPERLKMYWKG